MPNAPLLHGPTKNTASGRRGAFRLIDDRSGATAVEYTLIVALIALAVVLVIATIGGEVSAPFNTIAARL